MEPGQVSQQNFCFKTCPVSVFLLSLPYLSGVGVACDGVGGLVPTAVGAKVQVAGGKGVDVGLGVLIGGG